MFYIKITVKILKTQARCRSLNEQKEKLEDDIYIRDVIEVYQKKTF
jgi:hypothetical protein